MFPSSLTDLTALWDFLFRPNEADNLVAFYIFIKVCALHFKPTLNGLVIPLNFNKQELKNTDTNKNQLRRYNLI